MSSSCISTKGTKRETKKCVFAMPLELKNMRIADHIFTSVSFTPGAQKHLKHLPSDMVLLILGNVVFFISHFQ